jgi:hypothetical protein
VRWSADTAAVSHTASVFVGRERELHALRAALADALRDRGVLILLADEIALEASDSGATVVCVHCWEAGGATRELPDVFRREGEYWAIAYEGDAFGLKDSKGLRYIAHLLGAPGRDVHAIELVAAERAVIPGPCSEAELPASLGGDSGEILDAQAREAYRRRLAELEEELEQARRFGDPERAEALDRERDALVRELAAAFGLRGRPRRTGSPAERARVSATRAIRAAIARVREHSPALGEHLERTIHTGRLCSYTPDPRALVDWRL